MRIRSQRLSAVLLPFALVAPVLLRAQGLAKEAVLLDFKWVEVQGAYPLAGLIRDAAGNQEGFQILFA